MYMYRFELERERVRCGIGTHNSLDAHGGMVKPFYNFFSLSQSHSRILVCFSELSRFEFRYG